MSLLDSILNVFLGDKRKKDLKEVSPTVDSILKNYAELNSISNDDLRKITENFKEDIKPIFGGMFLVLQFVDKWYIYTIVLLCSIFMCGGGP